MSAVNWDFHMISLSPDLPEYIVRYDHCLQVHGFERWNVFHCVRVHNEMLPQIQLRKWNQWIGIHTTCVFLKHSPRMKIVHISAVIEPILSQSGDTYLKVPDEEEIHRDLVYIYSSKVHSSLFFWLWNSIMKWESCQYFITPDLLTSANYLNEKPMPLISFSPFTVKNPHRIFNTTAVFYGSMAANLIQSHTFFVVT